LGKFIRPAALGSQLFIAGSKTVTAALWDLAFYVPQTCMQPVANICNLRTLNGSLTFMLLIENLSVLLAMPSGKWKSVVMSS
jgi:hypothetical protein